MSLLLREYFIIFFILLSSIQIQIFLHQKGTKVSKIEKLNSLLRKALHILTQPKSDRSTFSSGKSFEDNDDDTADDDTADVSAEEMFESFEVEDEFGDLKLVNVSREWYAMSDVPRSTHPSHVEFNVGEVVKVMPEGSVGVVAGWDLTAKAPDDWLDEVIDRSTLSTPHYLILLDLRHIDVMEQELVYVAQHELEAVPRPERVVSLLAEDYFEGFRNGRHVMRPWLQNIYPYDV